MLFIGAHLSVGVTRRCPTTNLCRHRDRVAPSPSTHPRGMSYSCRSPLRYLHVPAPARDRLNREPHTRDSKVGGKPTAAVGTCALVLTIPQFLRFPKFISSPVSQVVLLPAHAYVQAPAGTIAEGPAGHGLITCPHLDEARLIRGRGCLTHISVAQIAYDLSTSIVTNPCPSRR